MTHTMVATAPAGFDGVRRAPAQGSALPAAGARSWSRLPDVETPCSDRLAGVAGAGTGGAMSAVALAEPAVALAEPAVVAYRAVRFRTAQHVIDLNTPTGTTLGIHSPGRPQS